MRAPALSLLVQIYGVLSALLLPVAFRRAYGPSMVCLFADLYREGWSIRGWRGGMRVAGREALGLLRTAWSERRGAGSLGGKDVVVSGATGAGGRLRGSPSGGGRGGWRKVFTAVADDVRDAARTIVRNPAMSFTVVVILALGIGANTAIFSVLNGVLLQPLPYPDPDRLAQLVEIREETAEPRTYQRVELFRAVRDRARTLGTVAGYISQKVTLSGAGDPLRVDGWAVTSSMFSMLGASPSLGRGFGPGDEQSGSDPVVVLSHALWQRRFGADPGAIGRTVKIDGTTHTVVGVMSAGFDFLGEDSDLWTPLVLSAARRQGGRPLRSLPVLARLGDGVSVEQADAELNAALDALRENPLFDMLYPGKLHLASLKERIVGEFRTELWMLQGAVALVLLIACSNVANLLLGRASSRRKEIAMRTALGCGRRRLIGQLLIESSMLALLAAAAGSLIAVWGARALVGLSPTDVPRIERIGLDPQVLLFTVLVALATGMVFGIVPALRAAGFDLREALGAAGSSGAGRRHRRLGSVLVVSQVSLALTLAIGAGLVANSLTRLMWVDPGYEPENVATLQIDLPPARYGSAELHTSFYDRLLERVSAVPDVRVAAVSTTLPLFAGYMGGGFLIEGDPEPTDDEVPVGSFLVVSPGYFDALRIPLARGRGLGGDVARDRLPVIVVNEALVDEHFMGRDPIGRSLLVGGEPFEIVGVAGNVKPALSGMPEPTIYMTHRRIPGFLDEKRMLGSIFLVARTAGDPRVSLPQILEIAESIDPELPVFDALTMRQRTWDSVARQRFYTTLLGLFSVVALALVATGIYGVVAYFVGQRIPEIGVRVALGAEPRDILLLVIGKGMLLTGLGVVLGAGGAVAATRFLSSLLFVVTPTDPLTFLSIAGLLMLVSLAALWRPARRAMSVDPMVALRRE